MKKIFLTHFTAVLFAHLALFFLFNKTTSHSTSSPGPKSSKVSIVGIFKEVSSASKAISSRPQNKLKPSHLSESVAVSPSVPASSESTNNDVRSAYYADLRSKIEEHKHYPTISRRLGQTGTVVVGFTLLEDGSMINLRVLESSRFEHLNASALEAVQRVKRFMPIPKELGESSMDIRVPLKFYQI